MHKIEKMERGAGIFNCFVHELNLITLFSSISKSWILFYFLLVTSEFTLYFQSNFWKFLVEDILSIFFITGAVNLHRTKKEENETFYFSILNKAFWAKQTIIENYFHRYQPIFPTSYIFMFQKSSRKNIILFFFAAVYLSRLWNIENYSRNKIYTAKNENLSWRIFVGAGLQIDQRRNQNTFSVLWIIFSRSRTVHDFYLGSTI